MITDETLQFKKTALYIRVSSEEQARFGDSLEAQKNDLLKFAKEHMLDVVDIYADEGVSARKRIKTRPEAMRLLSDVEAGKIELILFAKLDRWTRNISEYYKVQEIIERNKVEWKCTQEKYDTFTANGRLNLNIKLSIAQDESDRTGERIKYVNDMKVAKGEVISGTVPFGYSIKDKRLVKNDQNHIAKELFEYYKEHCSLNETVRYLQDEYGVYRETSSIRAMLKNTKYIGCYRGNDDYCEATIDKETFDRVQELIGRNIKDNKKHDYLYVGLIRCFDCGRLMSGVQIRISGHKRKDRTRKHYQHNGYRCSKAYNFKNRCTDRKVIYESVVEKYLLANIQDEIKDYIHSAEISQAPVHNNNKAKRLSIKNKMKKLRELYVNDKITMQEFDEDRQEFEKQLSEIVDIPPARRDLSHLKSVANRDLESFYSALDFEHKQRFWRSIIKEIRFCEDRSFKVIFL